MCSSDLAQIVLVAHEIVGTDGIVTVTVTLLDSGLLQVPTLQTALNVVVAFTFSLIDTPVLPFDQTVVPAEQPVAVKTTEPPAQTLEGVDEMVGASGLPTFTTTASDTLASHNLLLYIVLYKLLLPLV